MADEPQKDTPEETKEGLGTAGKATAVVGGAALGVGAGKAMVDRSIVNNLVEPYNEQYKIAKTNMESDARDLFPESDTGTIQRRAETAVNDIRHRAHETVAAADTDLAKSLRDDKTLLGQAKETVKKQWDNPESPINKKLQAQADEAFKAYGAGAEKIVKAGTDATAHEAATKELIGTMIAQAERTDRIHAAAKVKEISWVKRLNPFNKELHLDGRQKGLAVAAAGATAVIGAIGIGKAAQWMGGKGSDEVQKS